jgi:hypothetical protein
VVDEPHGAALGAALIRTDLAALGSAKRAAFVPADYESYEPHGPALDAA